ncbi:NADPH-dependent FMN reductase [Campylobacter geochelonis]|uniref:NADPH-dependent FMN reductase n=1 Tax=Campylobacter geochelonis TaxID=1780362 RepID=UPI000770AB41|nr:NAD(P)H-dependent oxidoreductase [Campylobacter geochelonis]CZE48739.1 Predicted flavoprotein [Campylobacter geochelonis]
MKLAVMVASLRKDSANRQIFENYQELAKNKFKFEEIEISNFPFYDSGVENLDIVIKANEQIAKCDGVLFFSPEYNYSLPAVLKNALDCISRVENHAFAKKPAAIIGASPSPIATARMQYHLRQIGVYLDLRFLNKPEALIGGVYEKLQDRKITDESLKAFLTRHADAFYNFIKESK